MNIDEAKSLITKIEREYKLYDFFISKSQPWTMCSESVMDYLMENEEQKLKGFEFSINKIITILGRVLKYSKLNKKLKEVDVLCISSSRFRVGNNTDVMANLYFDNLLDNKPSDISSVFLETPSLNEYDNRYKYANYSNVIPVDYIYIKSIFFRMLHKKEINAICNKIDMIFEDYLFYDFNLIEFIKEQLKISSIKLYTLNKSFKKLINKINPKVIIQIAGSNVYFNEYIDKIPVFEFQHGLISKYNHKGVFIKDKQSIDEDNSYMIVYNEYYKQLLPKITKLKSNNIFVYEYLKLVNMKDNSFKISAELGIQNKKIILFTSQPLKKAQKKIYSVIKDFLEVKNERNINDYKIIIKLHPRENLCEDYLSLNDVILLKQEYKLYDLLMVANIHLSYFSTVIEEAALFDIPNFILCKQGSFQRFGYLIKEQKALIYQNVEQLFLKKMFNSKHNRKYKFTAKNQYCEIWNNISEVLKHEVNTKFID